MPSLPSIFTPVPDLLSLAFPLEVNELSSVLWALRTQPRVPPFPALQ